MANNATLAEPVGTTPAPGSFKRRARRLGTVTGAVFGLIALGIAFAFFLSTNAIKNNTAKGGEVVVSATGLPVTAEGLYPTAASDGGENALDYDFSINNTNATAVRYTLAARCQAVVDGAPASNPDGTPVPCTEGDYAEQFEQLEVRIEDAEGTVLYQGRLADMTGEPEEGRTTPGTVPVVTSPTTTPPSGGSVALGDLAAGDTAAYTFFIWLNETGEVQPQNVVSAWTFDLSGRTV